MFSKLLYIVNIHVSSNKKEELKLRRSFLSVRGGGGGWQNQPSEPGDTKLGKIQGGLQG